MKTTPEELELLRRRAADFKHELAMFARSVDDPYLEGVTRGVLATLELFDYACADVQADSREND